MSTNSTMIPSIDEASKYGYRPTLYVCILYVALFSVTTTAHLIQIIFSRYWFLIPTVLLGGILEILGWVGRLWSNQNLLLDAPFTIQICCLIIGPTPLLAANFVLFGRLVRLLGTEYSRLPPRLYTWIFTSCDIISLIFQAVGGAMASGSDDGSEDFNTGTDLMIAGIAIQVAMMTIFVILAGEYLFRHLNDKPLRKSTDAIRAKEMPSESSTTLNTRVTLDTRRQLLIFALGFTTLLLFIRGVYRLVELSGGWDSEIMHTEWLFNVFDAALVTVTFYTWNFAHPSLLLDTSSSSSAMSERA
ncbi:envelope glycoprotein [Paramarasmius palmivorus]|uniref:Envelope glycoprotein n=1 Tax=Paramarasmius palmivorus TaxID=297713 RepID=A0AAW0CR79_9AGAR